jgi:hypothetical protein
MTNVSQLPTTQQRSQAAQREHSAGTVALVLGCLHAIPGFYKVAQGALASAQVVHAELPIAAQAMMIASMRVGLIQESAMFCMDLALIGVALLLRRGHGWARPLGFAWALAALAVLVGRAALFEVYLLPAATAFFEGPFPVEVTTWLRASTYLGLSLLAAFPFMFFVLLHRARSASF